MFSHPFLFTEVRLRLRRALRSSACLASACIAPLIVFASAGALAATATQAATRSAQAALISTAACSEAALSQPFARWADTNPYELVAGGNFEGSLTGWSLSGGAQRAAGSEPFGATGSVGGYSLALPAGASALSPFTCVNASYPSFRFFARNGGLASTVLVQVVYKTSIGPLTAPVGTFALGASWQPTAPMLTLSIAGGVLCGGTGQVALRFTALGGSSRIDDVYIDPRMR